MFDALLAAGDKFQNWDFLEHERILLSFIFLFHLEIFIEFPGKIFFELFLIVTFIL